LLKTLVYLLRPQVTSAFEVVVVAADGASGYVAGAEMDKVAKFLRIAPGVPHFELQFEGKLYQRCRLQAPTSEAALPFTYETSTDLEALESDPNASYP
jgi:hypothetical protein